jgi:hypothetical protein
MIFIFDVRFSSNVLPLVNLMQKWMESTCLPRMNGQLGLMLWSKIFSRTDQIDREALTARAGLKACGLRHAVQDLQLFSAYNVTLTCEMVLLHCLSYRSDRNFSVQLFNN